jgi:valyl-tRNA synthetase
MELAKAYDPQEAQKRWLADWDAKSLFHAVPDSRQPFAIVIPPPNVTGALHLGHALNNTLQDVLVRFHRARGENAMWMPGTDHAGIATQAVVERLVFQTEKKTRRDLGREELVKRIWQWKDKYEARILGQLRQLGASCDWQRTRFTLDETCARAVRQTFFDMFKDGLIFRGKRLVNWDAQLQTSVADDETYTEDTKGGFWTFRYPVTELPGEFIRFSTTRPETMLGDTAVCVHPADERYKHLVGKHVKVPLVGRDIPILADGQLADMALGTGCVKVTPAHDPNDYACYQRHPEIGVINILNPDGTINDVAPKYKGLDRYKARDAVVDDMAALGLFEGKEDRVIPLKYSDRSKTPIEPYLSDQWFVRMRDHDDGRPGLAQMAIDAVTSGKVKFFPERYAKTYLDWLGEKRDWCISRQLWWGHRVPVWRLKGTKTGPMPGIWDGSKPDADEVATPQDLEDHERIMTWVRAERVVCLQEFADDADEDDYPLSDMVCVRDVDSEIIGFFESRGYVQEDDVLDTWFSSALWPHSTLGWPESTPELAYWYPTSVLCTSRDIVTLWVARMVMTGLYNLGEIPFHHVYIHPKILDGFGDTMSKMKGNGIDPVDIIDRYGADALRFGMVHIASETQDSRMPISNVCPHCDTLVPVKQEHMYLRTRKVTCPNCKQPFRPGGPWQTEDPDLKTAKQAAERFEMGRNFANKIWNAARFVMMNLDQKGDADRFGPLATEDDAIQHLGAETVRVPFLIEDRWILSRLANTAESITRELETYRFAEVARLLYDFVWTEFCDWYLEMAKGRLKETDRAAVQRVLVECLDGICRLIQPIMPFLAESIWAALADLKLQRRLPVTDSVCVAAWPTYPDAWKDAAIETRIGRMQRLIRSVREIRNRYNVEPKTALTASVRCTAAVAEDLKSLSAFVTQLGGVGTLTIGPDAGKLAQSSGEVTQDFELYVSLAGLIDVAAEKKRLEKEIADKKKSLAGTQAKLGNAGFVAKAPPEVVAQQREQVVELGKQIAALEANLAMLG